MPSRRSRATPRFVLRDARPGPAPAGVPAPHAADHRGLDPSADGRRDLRRAHRHAQVPPRPRLLRRDQVHQDLLQHRRAADRALRHRRRPLPRRRGVRLPARHGVDRRPAAQEAPRALPPAAAGALRELRRGRRRLSRRRDAAARDPAAVRGPGGRRCSAQGRGVPLRARVPDPGRPRAPGHAGHLRDDRALGRRRPGSRRRSRRRASATTSASCALRCRRSRRGREATRSAGSGT